jgi:DNA-binding CsgD family transcriptional regulator/tetratricopeptide (TPR) repeat protein
MAADPGPPVLRGREAECAALDALVEDVREARSRVVVLRGEAGIGKSALLDHVEGRAARCRVARVAGVESEMEFAFAGLHHVCAPMLDGLDELPGPQRDALSTIFGLTAGPPPDLFLVGLGVLGLLTATADERPLVCLVDDAQWLDPATATTLAFVARRLLAEPVALVFAVRESETAPRLEGLPELPVRGLGDHDARALLDTATPGRLDERVRDRIVAEARGNPLALLELPRVAHPAELELGFGTPDAAAMASRLEQGFLRQLEPLPPETRRLLLVAAVEPLGDVTLLWRAADGLGLDRSAADPAEEARLVTFRGRVQFRHPLVRSAVHRTAAVGDVRAAHAALADATDPELDPERRAWHRAQAAAEPDDVIARELMAAAQHAQQRGALLTAAAFLARAAELTPDPGKRGARALTAALATNFAGEFEAALDLLEIAELCPLRDVQRGGLMSLRASILSGLGRAPDRPQLFLDAARTLHGIDPVRARDNYLCALGTQMFVGRIGGAETLREMAEAGRAAPPAGEPPRTMDLLLDALATRCADGYEAGLPALRRAVDAAIEADDPPDEFLQWLWFLPPAAPELWDDGAWDRLTERILARNRDMGAYSTLPGALQYRAEFELHAGRHAEATMLLDEADTIMDLTDRPFLTNTALEAAALSGDEARTLEVIAEAERIMGADRIGRTIGLGEHARAVLFNGLGRYEEACTAAQRACEFDDLGVHGRSLAELVEAATRSGATSEAEDALARLETRTAAAGTDWALGVAARSRALLLDGEAADAAYREAVERLARTRMATQLARAHLVYGEWLRREHRRVDAREQLRAAHDLLRGMGADGFAERARRELQATGETVRKRSPDNASTLTAQEEQIVRLAAEGATNPEIGSRLFISPRTVEYHLSKVFVKLGVSSRRELRTALR